MPAMPPAAQAPSPTERRAEDVRGMFDAIAPRYDLLNHLLSGGTDILWRRRLVRRLALPSGARILDVCCGTGDLGLAFGRDAVVTGCDFSPGMLARARAKGLRAVTVGDALALPFRDGTFDAAVCAFGFRNTADWARAARELARVVRPGGQVAILDFGMPEGLLAGPYRWYLRAVLPRLAGLLSRGEAYRYLQGSVEHFHASAGVAGLLRAAGCAAVERLPLCAGVAALWTGRKAA